MQVPAPRVNEQRVGDDGAQQRLTSRILPPYGRRSPQVAGVLPLRYRRGLSTGGLPRGATGVAGRGRGGSEPDEHRAADGRL